VNYNGGAKTRTGRAGRGEVCDKKSTLIDKLLGIVTEEVSQPISKQKVPAARIKLSRGSARKK